MTGLRFIEDRYGDLVDIEYYCECCRIPKGVSWWPCPEWPDYTVSCHGCGEVLHKGVEVSA